MQNVVHFLTCDHGYPDSIRRSKTVQRNNNNNNNNYNAQYYVHLTCSRHDTVKSRVGKSIRLISYSINRL